MQNKDDIIIRYLNGEISTSEKLELDRWRKETADNQAYFDKWRRIWQETEIAVDDFDPDVDAAWDKVSQSLDQMQVVEQSFAEPRIKPVSLTAFLLRIAAVLIVGSTVVWMAYQMSQEAKPGIAWSTKITHDNQRSEIVLADGSKVFLNNNSKLDYPDAFGEDTREVTLEGEAYFDIASNPDKSFVISARGTRTQVVGTSFNLRARPDEPEVTVSVTSGEVRFSEQASQDNIVTLTKGFQGIYHGEGLAVEKMAYQNTNFMAWQTGILVFEHAPLSNAIQVLEDHYGKSISLQGDGFGQCRLTSTFDNQPLTEVLDIIELVLEAQVEVEGDKITIIGTGCQN